MQSLLYSWLSPVRKRKVVVLVHYSAPMWKFCHRKYRKPFKVLKSSFRFAWPVSRHNVMTIYRICEGVHVAGRPSLYNWYFGLSGGGQKSTFYILFEPKTILKLQCCIACGVMKIHLPFFAVRKRQHDEIPGELYLFDISVCITKTFNRGYNRQMNKDTGWTLHTYMRNTGNT